MGFRLRGMERRARRRVGNLQERGQSRRREGAGSWKGVERYECALLFTMYLTKLWQDISLKQIVSRDREFFSPCPGTRVGVAEREKSGCECLMLYFVPASLARDDGVLSLSLY